MGDLLQDIHYAVRTLRASPAFTLVAVLTLALGIGATTAIFSVVEAVLLRPLPYRNPERLVVVGGELPGTGSQDLTASAPEFRDYRDRATTLVALAAAWPIDANLTSGVEPERVRAIAATPNLGPPAAERLGEIRVRTLILVGESDIPDVHAIAGAINLGVRSSTRDVIRDAGHLVPSSSPRRSTPRSWRYSGPTCPA